ncbi:MAG TPA: hypothetical protein VIF12_02215 [Micavibrio sp.]
MSKSKGAAVILTLALAATTAFMPPSAADARSMPAGSDKVVVQDIKVIAQNFYANNHPVNEDTIRANLSQYNSGQLNEINELYTKLNRQDLKIAPQVGMALARDNQNASIEQIQSRAVQDIYRRLANDIQQIKGGAQEKTRISYDLGSAANKKASELLRVSRDATQSVIGKMAAEAAQREVQQKYGTPDKPKFSGGFFGS